MKKWRRHWETWYPIIISAMSTVVFLFWVSDMYFVHRIAFKLLSDGCLSQIITIEVTLFGFLLAVLAIILQMNNQLIITMKKYNRFNDLIRFSKESIYSCFFVILLSIFVLLIKDSDIVKSIRHFVYYTFGAILIYNILVIFRFVKIFFLLATSK